MTYSRSETMKKKWTDPEFRERMIKIIRARSSSPEGRARMRQGVRDYWTSPRGLARRRLTKEQAAALEKIPKKPRPPRGEASKPPGCNLRKTPPRGPMTLCGDLSCFEKCVELTSGVESTPPPLNYLLVSR